VCLLLGLPAVFLLGEHPHQQRLDARLGDFDVRQRAVDALDGSVELLNRGSIVAENFNPRPTSAAGRTEMTMSIVAESGVAIHAPLQQRGELDESLSGRIGNVHEDVCLHPAA
jgi:hypothetical protein